MVAPGIMPIMPFAGPPLANLVIWCRTPIAGKVNNDEITSWIDLSGNGNHLVTGTFWGATHLGPTYNTSTLIGGHETLNFGNFGGDSRVLGVALDTSGYTAVSLYAVVKATVEGGGDGFWTMNISDFRAHHEYSDNNSYENAFTTARKTVGASDVATAHLWEVLSTASDYRVYRNGTILFTTGTNTFQGNAAGLTIGVSDDGAAGGTDFVWSGNWAEFLLYNALHNDATRQQVELYISARYGIF